MACFKLHHRRVFAGYEADLECFRVAKKVAVRRFVKAALDAETKVELSRESNKAVVKVAFFVKEAATAIPV